MEELSIEAYREQVVEILDRSPLFHGLQADHLAEAAENASLLRYEDGEAITLQGEPSDSFFLLIEGSATVLLESEDESPPLQLAQISPPDSIGEIGVLLETPRSASVVSDGGAILLCFATQRFHAMLLRLPYFGLVLCRTVASRLYRATLRIPIPEMGEPVQHPDPDALTLLPTAFLIRYRMLPLILHGQTLKLGCVEELDPMVLNLVREQLPGINVERVRITLEFFEKIMRSLGGVTGFSTPDASRDVPGHALVQNPHLDALLGRMVQEGASDLHLSARCGPRWRIDGEVHAIADLKPLGASDVLELLDPVMLPRHRELFETRHDVKFAYDLPDAARFRVKMFRDIRGVGAVLRPVPMHIPRPAQLGLSDAILGLTEGAGGMVLVAGLASSGRSTTTAALVNHINQTRAVHVVTLEDPVEFIHESNHALINQREIGINTGSLAEALDAVRFEDPDVVVVGAIEDAETANMALELAAAGVRVIAVVSARGAIQAIENYIALCDDDTARLLMARALRGVVCQALVRLLEGGRVAVFETLTADADTPGLIQTSDIRGLCAQLDGTLDDALWAKVEAGEIAAGEAMRVAINSAPPGQGGE